MSTSSSPQKQRSVPIGKALIIIFCLVYIITLIVIIISPFPSWFHEEIYTPFCIHTNLPSCNNKAPITPYINPISVTTLPVKDTQNVESTMKIGILANENQSQEPFNQYDTHNN